MEDYTEKFEVGPLFDDDGIEDDEEKPKRKKWERRFDEYELSKFSYFPARVRQLINWHAAALTVFLNEFESPAEEGRVCLEVDQTANLLPNREDFEAVVAYLPEAEAILVESLNNIDDESHWGEYSRIRAYFKDLKMLRMLRWTSKCVAPTVMRAWSRAVGGNVAFEQRPEVLRFWRLKAEKERTDPKAVAALRARQKVHEVRRKGDVDRQEYVQDYWQRPDVKARKAAQMRARRASTKGVQEAAE